MIQLRDLTKRFGSTTAVDGLSFDVQPGRVTGFLGPNGSGKSTTFRMIMGLDRPSGGRALVNGRPYAELPWPLREVGALLDGRAFHVGRTAEAHLVGLALTNRIPRSRVATVLDLVGLASVANRRAGTLSLGMGQRLGIAAAMLGDPGTVLLDEPVNGLDPEGIRWVRGLARRLAGEGRTVFLSSHLIAEMELTAHDLVVIGRGRVIAQGSMVEMTAGRVRSVWVRSPDPDRLAQAFVGSGMAVSAGPAGMLAVASSSPKAVAEVAARAGIAVHELTPVSSSLEEVFLELTDDSIDFRSGAAQSTVRSN